MEYIVGMGEFVVAGGEDDTIRTFALASCVAVTVYSPVKRAAGMIHVVLPSPLDNKDVTERPSYFATTGIPMLIEAMRTKHGCRKEELQIHMYGGAESMLQQDIYNVGKKNIDAVKRTLMDLGLSIHKADLRGSDSRSIYMQVKTGAVEVYRQPIQR